MNIKISFSSEELKTIKRLKQRIMESAGKEFSDEQVVESLLKTMACFDFIVNPVKVDPSENNNSGIYEVLLPLSWNMAKLTRED